MRQPPVIAYNLKDRGRKFRGKERNFNIKEIYDSIHSPATQERVKTRAMLGYYGHKPRILANSLEPSESVVIKGQYNEIEPAIVTTSLDMSMDGTITHKTEFLDTAAGRKASKMFEGRIGGFSSAIDERAPEFFGFDYVLDPNYSTNRGFSLDSVGMTLDEVKGAAHEEEDLFIDALVASKDSQIELLSLSLDSAQTENEQLISMLASDNEKQGIDVDAIAPITISLDSTVQMQRDIDAFKNVVALPGFVKSADKKPQVDRDYDKLVDRMGINA